jgi:hypothetical protein
MSINTPSCGLATANGIRFETGGIAHGGDRGADQSVGPEARRPWRRPSTWLSNSRRATAVNRNTLRLRSRLFHHPGARDAGAGNPWRFKDGERPKLAGGHCGGILHMLFSVRSCVDFGPRTSARRPLRQSSDSPTSTRAVSVLFMVAPSSEDRFVVSARGSEATSPIPARAR